MTTGTTCHLEVDVEGTERIDAVTGAGSHHDCIGVAQGGGQRRELVHVSDHHLEVGAGGEQLVLRGDKGGQCKIVCVPAVPGRLTGGCLSRGAEAGSVSASTLRPFILLECGATNEEASYQYLRVGARFAEMSLCIKHSGTCSSWCFPPHLTMPPTHCLRFVSDERADRDTSAPQQLHNVPGCSVGVWKWCRDPHHADKHRRLLSAHEGGWHKQQVS